MNETIDAKPKTGPKIVQVEFEEPALIHWLEALKQHRRLNTNRTRQELAVACSRLRDTLRVVRGEGPLAALKDRAEKEAAEPKVK